MTNRNTQRSSFNDHTRLVLLEQDADASESDVSAIRAEVKTTNLLLRSMLASLALASVLLAINLAVRGVTP